MAGRKTHRRISQEVCQFVAGNVKNRSVGAGAAENATQSSKEIPTATYTCLQCKLSFSILRLSEKGGFVWNLQKN